MRSWVGIAAVLFMLSACAPQRPAPERIIAEGTLYHVKQSGLVVQTATGYAFLDIENREVLKELRALGKGEPVIVVGDRVQEAKDSAGESFVPEAIILANGKHLYL